MSKRPLEECFFVVLRTRVGGVMIDESLECTALAAVRPLGIVDPGQCLRVVPRGTARASLPPPSSDRSSRPLPVYTGDTASALSGLFRVDSWSSAIQYAPNITLVQFWVTDLISQIQHRAWRDDMRVVLCHVPPPLDAILIHMIALMRRLRVDSPYDPQINCTRLLKEFASADAAPPPSSSRGTSCFLLPPHEMTPRLTSIARPRS